MQQAESDLQLGAYITAHTVQELFATETGRHEAVSLLRCNGFTKRMWKFTAAD